MSWSKIAPISWRRFMAAISENRTLSILNMSHNKILEKQTSLKDELSAHNAETLSYFKSFIKYNCYLTTVNLENTGLIKPAITFICNLLPRAQGLRCLHLCANEGITDDTIEWVH